ncbi:MAG: hypothetical protein ACK4TA_23590 [Saprospiraceae bacterium]
MKWKQLLFVAALSVSSLMACNSGGNQNQNDGTGEMPEDPTMGTGDNTGGNEDVYRDTMTADTLREDTGGIR